MEVDIETNDGHKDTLDLEENVPANIGRKTRMKIEADAEGDESGREEYVIKNAISSKEKAKQFLVRNMMDESNCDYSLDDLTLESYDRISNKYWPQIQGKKKGSEES